MRSLRVHIFQFFIFLLPIQLGLHFWPTWSLVKGIRVDYLSPTLFLTDLLLLIVVIFSCGEVFKKNKKILKIILTIILLFLLFYVRDFESLYKALKTLEFIYLIFYALTFSNEIRKTILKPLQLSVFYIVPIAILQFLNRGSLNGIFYFLGERSMFIDTPGIAKFFIFGKEFLRPYSVFPHPNVMAGYLLVVFFLLNKSKWTRALILIGLFLSYSQSVWLAFLIINSVNFVNKKWFISFDKYLLFFGLSFSLLLPIVSFYLLSNGYVFSEFIQKRLELSVIAGNIISKNPILGVGIGNFIPNIPKGIISIQIFNTSIWWLQPVHNIYLLVFSEMGIVGLTGFVYWILRALKNKDLVLSSSFAVILITGLFDHYWLTLQQTFFLLAILIGLLLSKNTGRIKN